jgi:hypothetical protein
MGDFIGSSGRSANAVGPRLKSETRIVSYGAWTFGEAEGVTGEGVLARVIISGQGQGTSAEIRLTGVTLTDPHGWPLSDVEVAGDVVTIECGAAGIPDRESILPKAYALYPARPNPSAASTIIGFAIPASAGAVHVEVVIYNVAGQVVRRLARASYGPGHHQLEWDSRDANGALVSPGVYFCNLRAGQYKETRRLSLVR